jgi:ribonuclease P/MRP protein subunit POP5
LIKRFRRRYLAIRIISEQTIYKKELIKKIWESFLSLYGDYGASQVNIYLVAFDQVKNLAVLRCSHRSLDKVRASLASITEINKKRAGIHVDRISGTLKSLKRKTSDFRDIQST